MIIRVDAAGARLDAPEELKGFKLVVEDGLAGEALARAVAGLGTLEGEHVWVSADWVRGASGLATDPAWQQGFDGMLAYATRKGWVNDQGAIRAHIERA